MAQDKRQVDAITARDVDFAQWYTDVCKKAELIDYTSVKGMFIYRPYGYALWENIQAELDRRFKATGHENVYLPVLIPESLLQKEKDHVEGFAPECAWVTVVPDWPCNSALSGFRGGLPDGPFFSRSGIVPFRSPQAAGLPFRRVPRLPVFSLFLRHFPRRTVRTESGVRFPALYRSRLRLL